ncbi:13537_t:CDS:2, partial [Entrophospora sp. SA101]
FRQEFNHLSFFSAFDEIVSQFLVTRIKKQPQTKKESQSNNSSEQNGEDMVQMFSVFQ